MTIAASSSTGYDDAGSIRADAAGDGGNVQPGDGSVADTGSSDLGLPDGYSDIRENADIQFSPIELKDIEPREPSWFGEWLRGVFEWLGDVFSPVSGALASGWPVLKWVLLAMLVAFAAYFAFRIIGPLAFRGRNVSASEGEVEPQWQPDRQESIALLEDADALAAQGRFDEATHLLLRRSVSQIAAARPDWVDPSSTARELAALPALSQTAQRTFAIISEAVERSLFALKQLSQEDWQTARAAYADFALARIDSRSDAAPAPADATGQVPA